MSGQNLRVIWRSFEVKLLNIVGFTWSLVHVVNNEGRKFWMPFGGVTAWCLSNTSWVTIFLTDLRTYFCMHNAAEFKSNVLIKLSLLVPTCKKNHWRHYQRLNPATGRWNHNLLVINAEIHCHVTRRDWRLRTALYQIL